MTYRPLPKEVTIKESDIEGLGLYATKYLIKGANLGVTHIVDDRFEDDLIRTPLGGFINHVSVSPNCYLDKCDDVWYLITKSSIQEGEELTLKYTMYDPGK